MAGSRILLYGLSLSFALVIAIVALFIPYYPYLLVPVVTYICSIGFNLLSKYSACDEVAFKGAAINALFPVCAVLIAFLIVSIAPAIKAPIKSLIPNALPATQDVVGNTFYVFWAAMYGQILGGGFSQICNVR